MTKWKNIKSQSMSTFNPKSSFRVMKMIFTVIFVSPLLFFTVILLSMDFTLSSFEFNSLYNLGIIAIIGIVIPVTINYSNRILRSIQAGDSLQSRMAKFQTSLIIRLAGWESLGLFSIIAMMENTNAVVLGFFVVSMGGLFMNYPSINNLGKSVQLSSAEIQELSN